MECWLVLPIFHLIRLPIKHLQNKQNPSTVGSDDILVLPITVLARQKLKVELQLSIAIPLRRSESMQGVAGDRVEVGTKRQLRGGAGGRGQWYIRKILWKADKSALTQLSINLWISKFWFFGNFFGCIGDFVDFSGIWYRYRCKKYQRNYQKIIDIKKNHLSLTPSRRGGEFQCGSWQAYQGGGSRQPRGLSRASQNDCFHRIRHQVGVCSRCSSPSLLPIYDQY